MNVGGGEEEYQTPITVTPIAKMVFEAKSHNVTVYFTNAIKIVSTEHLNKTVYSLLYSIWQLFL